MLVRLMEQVSPFTSVLHGAHAIEGAPGEAPYYDTEAIYDGYTDVDSSHKPRQ